MHILRSLRQPPAALRGAAVALGNFDGVHRGHQAVLAAVQAAAAHQRVPVAVLSFEPHPRQLFRPDDPPFRLTPFRAKALRLRAQGVEILYLARFDRGFSRVSAEAFVRDLLGAGLGARHVVVGEDFVFGHQRGGTVATLRQLAPSVGFDLTVVPTAGQGAAFKSSTVRGLLRDGSPAAAADVLGHWWQITGRVRHGDARGRALGYPTANLGLGPLLRPRFGVYAVRARLEGETALRAAVASIGTRPMFGGDVPLIEVHLFDFQGDLYGRHLCVDVVEFIRPEATFADVAALRRQMDADSAKTKAILADPRYGAQRFPRATA